MKTTISANGQIVLPAEFRHRDRIEAGQQFEIERVEAGEYLLKKVAIPHKQSLLEWLLACPEKGWYQPIPSELTNTITRKL